MKRYVIPKSDEGTHRAAHCLREPAAGESRCMCATVTPPRAPRTKCSNPRRLAPSKASTEGCFCSRIRVVPRLPAPLCTMCRGAFCILKTASGTKKHDLSSRSEVEAGTARVQGRFLYFKNGLGHKVTRPVKQVGRGGGHGPRAGALFVFNKQPRAQRNTTCKAGRKWRRAQPARRNFP